MTMCIGIDIGARAIRLVELSRRFGKLSVLSTAEHKRPGEGGAQDPSAVKLISAEIDQLIRPRANTRVAVGLPYDQVFFSSLVTELGGEEEVRRLLGFELEDDIPIAFEELVTDICGRRSIREGKYEYLIAAVSRSNLHFWTDTVTRAGHRCSVVSPGVCALQAALEVCGVGCPDGIQTMVHVDDGRAILGIVENGSLVRARHLSCTEAADGLGVTLAREIELMLHAGYRKPDRPLSLYLSGSLPLVQELSATAFSSEKEYETHQVNLASSVHASAGVSLGSEHAMAFGLAAMALQVVERTVNLVDADVSDADTAVKSKVRRRALISMGLLMTILGLFGVKIFGDLHFLEVRHSKVKGEMRTVFAEVFPDEKKIVNELAQMTERTESLHKEYDMLMATVGKKIRPLKLLHILSEKATPDKGITISSFSVAEKTVRINGTAQSFESVEQFLDSLRQVSYFHSVEVEDMQLGQGSKHPEFRLLATIEAG